MAFVHSGAVSLSLPASLLRIFRVKSASPQPAVSSVLRIWKFHMIAEHYLIVAHMGPFDHG